MSLISADSTREFLTLGSHVFSWGLSQAASGYIYDSPSSQTTPPPHLATVILTTWTQAYVVAATFQKALPLVAAILQGGVSGGWHHQDTSWKGLILLISRMAERLLRRTREGCHLLGWNVRKIIGEKKEKKSMWRFCLRSNSTWAAYRPRQHLEWDEDWKEEG